MGRRDGSTLSAVVLVLAFFVPFVTVFIATDLVRRARDRAGEDVAALWALRVSWVWLLLGVAALGGSGLLALLGG